jgi:hypothetical protein
VPEHPAVHVARYEDMVRQPQETFAAMAQHLGFVATPEQVRQAIADTSFDRLDAAEQKGGFRERPDGTKKFFREGRADQWREILTPAQIAAIVRNHREQMKRFGYLTPEVAAAT